MTTKDGLLWCPPSLPNTTSELLSHPTNLTTMLALKLILLTELLAGLAMVVAMPLNDVSLPFNPFELKLMLKPSIKELVPRAGGYLQPCRYGCNGELVCRYTKDNINYCEQPQ